MKRQKIAFICIINLFLLGFLFNGFAQTVKVEPGICYHNTVYLEPVIAPGETEEPSKTYYALKLAIETKQQKNHPSVKTLAWAALIGQQFTKYLQISYSIRDGTTNPFASGNYVECKLGCFRKFNYYGETYQNVCINNICEEGRVANTPLFCDPSTGNDVYYRHLTFWCKDVPRPAMICGEGGKCAEAPGSPSGFQCKGYPISPGSNSPNNNAVEYAIIAPINPNNTFLVAAYQNGKIVAQKPISNLSAEEYILKNGPVHSSQAYSFAQSTGLTSMVASAKQQRTATTASSTTYSASYDSGVSYSPTANRATSVTTAPTSQYRASSALSVYRKPTATHNTYSATSTTYAPSTTTQAYNTGKTKTTTPTNYYNYYTTNTAYTPIKTTYNPTTSASKHSNSTYRAQATSTTYSTTYNPVRAAYTTKNTSTSAYRNTGTATASASGYR